MIIIKRSYRIDMLTPPKVEWKTFADDDLIGVQKFLDERYTIRGYEWYDLNFEFTKL